MQCNGKKQISNFETVILNKQYVNRAAKAVGDLNCLTITMINSIFVSLHIQYNFKQIDLKKWKNHLLLRSGSFGEAQPSSDNVSRRVEACLVDVDFFHQACSYWLKRHPLLNASVERKNTTSDRRNFVLIRHWTEMSMNPWLWQCLPSLGQCKNEKQLNRPAVFS